MPSCVWRGLLGHWRLEGKVRVKVRVSVGITSSVSVSYFNGNFVVVLVNTY